MSSVVSLSNLFNISNSDGECKNMWYEFQCAMFCDPRQSSYWYDGGFSISESFCQRFFSACSDVLVDPTSTDGESYIEALPFCQDLNHAVLQIIVPTFFSPHPTPESTFDGVESYPIAYSNLESIESAIKFPPYLVDLQLENDQAFTFNVQLVDNFGNHVIRNFFKKRANLAEFQIDGNLVPSTATFQNSFIRMEFQGISLNASSYTSTIILDGSLNLHQTTTVKGFPATLNVLPGPLAVDAIIFESESLHSSVCGYPDVINMIGTDSFGNKIYYPFSNTEIVVSSTNSNHFEYSSQFRIVENMWYLYYSNYDCNARNFTLSVLTNGNTINQQYFEISTITYYVSQSFNTGVVGNNLTFTVTSRNGSTPISNVVLPDLVTRMIGPNDSLVYQSTEIDGTISLVTSTGEYIGMLYTTKAGTYDIIVQMKVPQNNTLFNVNQRQLEYIYISEIPFSRKLLPKAAKCQYTTATGPGLSSGLISISTTFTISSKDMFGNLDPSSNLTYSMLLSQGGAIFPSIKYFYNVSNQHNGLFLVNYTSTTTYNVQLNILCMDPSVSPVSQSIIEGPYSVRFPLSQVCLNLLYCSNNGACVGCTCLCRTGFSGAVCQIPPPPALVSARFSSKIVTIELEFDRETNKAGTNGQAQNCSFFLATETLNKFTSDNSCYWRDAKTLVAFPGTNSPLKPNDTITFLPNILRDINRVSNFSRNNLSLPLQIPSIINPFRINVITPTVVSQFSSITLDISSSIGTGGRPIGSIVWSAAAVSVSPSADINSLNSFLQTKNSTKVVFAKGQLAAGIYNFTVSAKNFLGSNDSITFPLTVLEITKTQVNSGVSNYLVVSTSSPVSFLGQVETPCFSENQLNFESVNFAWVRKAGDYFQVDTVLSTEKNFLISPNSVPAQSVFDLEFGATVDDSELLSSYDKIKIVVQPSLFPIINDGNKRLSRIQNITLDARNSLDPGSNFSFFNWIWSCTTSTFGVHKNCLEEPLSSNVFKNSPVINIPPATLWYLFIFICFVFIFIFFSNKGLEIIQYFSQ